MAATAQQEVESLDRVLTRLATTEENNLEKVRTTTAYMHELKFRCLASGTFDLHGTAVSWLQQAVLADHDNAAIHELQVLIRLLPIVIGQLKSPHDLTRKKVRRNLKHCL